MQTATIRKQQDSYYVSFGITHRDGEFQVLKDGKFYNTAKGAEKAKQAWEAK